MCGTHYQFVARNRGTGHERATVYLLTLPRNCPRFRDLHGIRSNFTTKLLLRRGRVRSGGDEKRRLRELSHFVHCACPRFDNARLARRHESDPQRRTVLFLIPFSLSFIFHRCSNCPQTNPDYDAAMGCLTISIRDEIRFRDICVISLLILLTINIIYAR